MAAGGHLKKKLCIDLKWWEMDQKWFLVIQNDPNRTSKKGHLKKKSLCIDLKWREMRSKVIFGHPKWPPAAILWNLKINPCILIWNSDKCDRKWLSVIQNGRRQPFCEKNQKSKLRIDLKWRDMWSKVIFGHPKWPPAAILWKKKVAYWSEIARNTIESDFRSSKIQSNIKPN